MIQYKYIVAYDASACEYERFDTFDEAKKWLIDNQDFSEGIPEEIISGECFIAKITHVTKINKTDWKENYRCKKEPAVLAHCSDCIDDDCTGTEEWPHDSDYDYVGDVVLEQIITECEALDGSKITWKKN